MSETEEKEARLSPLPDVGDIIFILILQLLLFSLPRLLLADGSTGWHLVAGDYILKNGAVPHQDLISYTRPGAPWVAYEWSSDLIMALAVSLAGLNGLAVLVASIIAFVFLVLYQRCRRTGCHFVVATLLVTLGSIASSIHWLARPHIFTFLGVLSMCGLLERLRKGTIGGARFTVLASLTMLAWANLHPAFLLGFLLVGIYLVSDIVLALVLAAGAGRAASLARARWLGAGLAAAVVATLVNPNGFGLYRYIFEYFQRSRVLAATDEYFSPVFHGGLQPSCFLLLFAALAAGLTLSRKRPALAQFLSCMCFGAMALGAVRNMPLFVIVALPVIAELCADAALFADGPEGASGWWRRLTGRWKAFGDDFDSTERRCKLHLLPVLAVISLFAIAAGGGSAFSVPILDSDFDGRTLPTTTLSYVRDHKLKPEEGFNTDNWGGYIRYRLGIPVFIDDRVDFYGEPLFVEYAAANTASPGWRQVLDKHHIGWALVGKDGRLAACLAEEPGWKLVASDAAGKLFVRVRQEP